MVPLDPPPLIKGSSNECRESGQRGLGQMNIHDENDCPVIYRKTRKSNNKKKGWWSEYQWIGNLVQDLDSI